ncbi:MAG: MFS transporter [Oligoflexia bacterium]|nr:MFS transporter [Oligoflexia bacterium]
MKQRSPLFIVFLTIFIDLVGFGIVLPLSPFYAQHFGATAVTVGLLMASYSLMQFLFAPVWGGLSDRVGRRPIILMSLLGSTVSYFIFAMATNLSILFIARLFQGVFGANISATQAYVADVTDEKSRSKGMGLIGAAFGLGFIFGPAIGAKLSEAGPAVGTFFGIVHAEQSLNGPLIISDGIFGMGFPALVASAVCLFAFCLAYFKLPESLPPEKRATAVSIARESRIKLILRSMTQTQAGWLIFVFFLSTVAMANLEATLALFTEARFSYGVRQTGNLFAFVGVMMAFTQGYLIRKLFPKFGERKMAVAGPLLAAFGFLCVALSYSSTALYITMILVAIGTGITNPAILGGISLLTDPKQQGAVMGVTQSLSSLARILGPLLGGVLFGHIGPAAPYIAAAAISCFVLFIVIKNVHKLPNSGKSNVSIH